jgi:hypothetical protein
MITEYEAKVIRYAAVGKPRMGNTDEMWEAIKDLTERGLMTTVQRGLQARVVPTPEGLEAAWEQEEAKE